MNHFFQCCIGRDVFRRNRYNSTIGWRRTLVVLPWYFLQLVFGLLDLLLIGEGLNQLILLTSSKKRKLKPEEFHLLSELKGEEEYIRSIWVIERSWLSRLGKWMTHRKSLGLGIGRTVHFSRVIDSSEEQDQRWLIHEIAHTLQYKYRGLIYIPEALIAQQFSGYAFGGKQTLDSKKKLREFNPEQQADIFCALIISGYNSALKTDIRKGEW